MRREHPGTRYNNRGRGFLLTLSLEVVHPPWSPASSGMMLATAETPLPSAWRVRDRVRPVGYLGHMTAWAGAGGWMIIPAAHDLHANGHL